MRSGHCAVELRTRPPTRGQTSLREHPVSSRRPRSLRSRAMESGSVEAQLFDPGPSNPLGLASIHVEELHGKFTYTVDLGPSKGASGGTSTGALFTVNEDRLTLLYGSNG